MEHLKDFLGGSPALAQDLICNHFSRAGLSDGMRGRFSNAGQIEPVRGSSPALESEASSVKSNIDFTLSGRG